MRHNHVTDAKLLLPRTEKKGLGVSGLSDLIGEELTPALLDLFSKKITTVVVATTDEDGWPRTAPVNFIVANDKKTLRMALSKNHHTLANIRRDGRVNISILDEGDTAASVRGTAYVLKECMDINYSAAIVEVKVTQVKNDASMLHLVTQGVRTRHRNEPTVLYFRTMFNELSSCE
jgi:uncharacterized pyridoxamine 5'-phosphate oxidase family protein